MKMDVKKFANYGARLGVPVSFLLIIFGIAYSVNLISFETPESAEKLFKVIEICGLAIALFGISLPYWKKESN